MDLSKKNKGHDLPRSVRLRGHYTVYAGSEERHEKLRKLMELTGTNSLTNATWEAIDFFLKHNGKEKRGGGVKGESKDQT